MGFVCFKNLCMIIIFILLTTYYISAFRLIHTHAELPETEIKKDIKEHARKAYTLKDHDHREHKNQSIHVKLDGFETEITPEKKMKTMQPTRTPDTLKEKIKEGLKNKEVDEEEKPKIKIIQKDIQGKSKFVALNEDSKKEEPKKSSKNIKESSVKASDDKKVKPKEESNKIVKEVFTKKVEDPTKSKIKIIQKDTEAKSKLTPVKKDGQIEIKKDAIKSKPKTESKAISKDESSKIVKELFSKKDEPSKPVMKIIQKDTEGKAKFVSVTDKSKEEISKAIKKDAPKTPAPSKASKTSEKPQKTSEKPQKETPKIVKEPPVSQKKKLQFQKNLNLPQQPYLLSPNPK